MSRLSARDFKDSRYGYLAMALLKDYEAAGKLVRKYRTAASRYRKSRSARAHEQVERAVAAAEKCLELAQCTEEMVTKIYRGAGSVRDGLEKSITLRDEIFRMTEVEIEREWLTFDEFKKLRELGWKSAVKDQRQFALLRSHWRSPEGEPLPPGALSSAKKAKEGQQKPAAESNGNGSTRNGRG